MRKLTLAAIILLSGAASAGVHVPYNRRFNPIPATRVLPYVLADSLSQRARASVAIAVSRWNIKTEGILQLREAKPGKSAPHVRFRGPEPLDVIGTLPPKDARSLGEGMLRATGANDVLVGEDAEPEIVLHAIGHRLGLGHEYRHCQRDEYLSMSGTAPLWLRGEAEKACSPWSSYISTIEYDIESIMHHHPAARTRLFIKDYLRFLLDTRGQSEAGVFSAYELSDGDVRTLAHLYCFKPGSCPNAKVLVPRPVETRSYTKSDYVIFLVSGPELTMMPFGRSGLFSAWVAPAPVGMSPGPPLALTFAPHAFTRDVVVERRSAKKVNNPDYYGEFGYIPPGIYFLHYHISAKKGVRLGMSDGRCGMSAECEKIQVPGIPQARTWIQFHEAYNNLDKLKSDISEGCVTATFNAFATMFPPSFLDANTSPLRACVGKTYSGEGNILVFVTDDATAGKQTGQLTYFRSLLPTMTTEVFDPSSARLKAIRDQWK